MYEQYRYPNRLYNITVCMLIFIGPIITHLTNGFDLQTYVLSPPKETNCKDLSFGKNKSTNLLQLMLCNILL